TSGSPPGVRGENLADVCLIEMSLAAGATPENPSSPGWPAISPAMSVPWPSQSVRPSVDSTKSPPGSTLGSRGPGCTPVSMTATVWPSPGECRQAWVRLSATWLGLTAPGSVPGSTVVDVHGLRCCIGCAGPALPDGGGVCASTDGGMTAPAAGHAT